MPEPFHSKGAVFISYGSQDAVAAGRICEALQATGIEVWLDQTELRGGDSWDSTIKKQILDCALFLPVISAQTNARIEGYFRREWNLATRAARHGPRRSFSGASGDRRHSRIQTAGLRARRFCLRQDRPTPPASSFANPRPTLPPSCHQSFLMGFSRSRHRLHTPA